MRVLAQTIALAVVLGWAGSAAAQDQPAPPAPAPSPEAGRSTCAGCASAAASAEPPASKRRRRRRKHKATAAAAENHGAGAERTATATAATSAFASRYSFNRVDDGFLRLDHATGQIAYCSAHTVGWACQAVPEDRAALEREIGRLQDEVAALKKEVAELRAQPPPAPRPAAAPPRRTRRRPPRAGQERRRQAAEPAGHRPRPRLYRRYLAAAGRHDQPDAAGHDAQARQRQRPVAHLNAARDARPLVRHQRNAPRS